jgi:phosphinothricin acetyltransferase
MPAALTPLTPQDRKEVIDIFNGHVLGGFAAYPETPVPYEFYDLLLKAVGDHPTVAARAETGELLGYGFLRPWHPLPAFAATAEVTYFLKPTATRQGLGTRMLARLEEEARALGITSILANVSSLNEASRQFHLKRGFVECGRFVGVGRKLGRVFDTVWLQKRL